MQDIKCVLCEYLGMSSTILQGIDFFCCSKQNPNAFVCDVEKLYENCPLPKEELNQPENFKQEKQELHWQQKYVELKKNFVNLKEINAKLREKQSPRVTYTDGWTVVNPDKQKYELFKENAKLKEDLAIQEKYNKTLKDAYDESNYNFVEANLGWNRTMDKWQELQRAYHKLEEAYNDKQKCLGDTIKKWNEAEEELERLKSKLPKVGWIAFTDHVKQVTDLNNEIQTIKAKQLSKDEIHQLTGALKWMTTDYSDFKGMDFVTLKPILVKLQSMESER